MISSGGLHKPTVYGTQKLFFEQSLRNYERSDPHYRSTSNFFLNNPVSPKLSMSPKLSNVLLAKTSYKFSPNNLKDYQKNASIKLSKPKKYNF